MNKIILSKKAFLKALFQNKNIDKFCKILNNEVNNTIIFSKTKTSKTIFKEIKMQIKKDYKTYDISILIINKELIALFNDSSDGGEVLSIIGNNYKKEKIKSNQNYSKKASDNIINFSALPPSKKKPNITKTPINISKQKKLISKVVILTPNISRKHKLVMNVSKQKENLKKKSNEIKKENIKKKPNEIKKENIKKKPNEIKKPERKEITKQKAPNKKVINQKHSEIKSKQKNNPKTTSKEPIKKKENNTKVVQNRPKAPKYKLQKKSPNLIALFSVSVLIGLIGMLSHKKVFPSILAVSALAFLGHRAINNTNKKLVKKI